MGGKYDDPIVEARVLDLFAGTGALGLEALSRGADHVTFVDDGRKAQSLVMQNITLCKATDPANPDAPYDLIFLDPPYGKALGEKAMAAAITGGWLTPRALIVWEDSADIIIPEALTLLDQRKYGETKINILEPK